MQQLTRNHIADWIRERRRQATSSARFDQKTLVNNMYTSLRLAVSGSPLGMIGLAQNTLALCDILKLDIVDTAISTNETKGKDYAPGTDILGNFYRVADVCGVSPLTVWGVYVTKHAEAVRAYVMTGKLESEPIDSRLVDILVYSALGFFIAEREAVGS